MENKKSSNAVMQSSQLMKLFDDELKDLYWAEKAITKAMPTMIKNPTSKELLHALTSHLEIASYGTLSQFAETLGLTKAVTLLKATLKEEKAANEKLSEAAINAINLKAAQLKAYPNLL